MNDIQQFLHRFNEHWVRPDVDAILGDVTDDIHFAMAGKPPIVGKAEFRKMLDEMAGQAGEMDMRLETTLVDGDRAMVSGLISMPGEQGGRKAYAFCDVYRLAGGKVAELKAYVVEVEQA